MADGEATYPLFTYGTLQEPAVQLAVLGRTVRGAPDALPGFVEVPVLIDGETYLSLHPKHGSVVKGRVIALTEDELLRADAYEGPTHYVRIEVDLQSGLQAFAYVSAEG